MPSPRIKHDRFLLTNPSRQCEIIAASDPDFPDLKPDQWTAYARVHFGKSLPMVVGPESINGTVFGMHPAVLARSFPGIIHKQVNLGHTLRSLGKREDRICGCVLYATFPEEPEGGWTIPASVEEAPEITVVSALHKQAHGVPKMLGDHLGGKVEMSVSMEFTYYFSEMGIYDPGTGACYDRKDIPASIASYTYQDDNGRLGIRKNARNPQLVILLGGVSGRIWFSGYGYTQNPAELTAGIDQIAASRREEGMVVCGSMADIPEYAPGMDVVWPSPGFGRGKVAAVYLEGTYSLGQNVIAASAEDPVLRIVLPDGVAIIRSSSTVRKKN
jgi:hypothetical protein